MVAKPESFFVTLKNHLEPGEEARAQEWGKRLAARVLSNDVTNTDPVDPAQEIAPTCLRCMD
jgi:hypothetical protein